jgi:hypothetical protein
MNSFVRELSQNEWNFFGTKNDTNSFLHNKGIKTKNQSSSFSPGDRIKHAQYGMGTIVSIRDAVADIAFSWLGIKKMNIEIAPIEKI